MLSVWLTKDGRPQSIKSGTPRRYTPTITYNPSFILYSLSLRFFFFCLSVKACILSLIVLLLSPFVDIWSCMAWNFQSRIYKYFMYKLSVLLWPEKQDEIRKISQNISHILILNCTLPIYLIFISTRVIWPK